MMSARLNVMGLGVLAAAAVLSFAATSSAGDFNKSGDHFVLKVHTDCNAKKECDLHVEVRGNGGFHVNTEFPTAFKVVADTDARKMVIVNPAQVNVKEELGKVDLKIRLDKGDKVAGTVKFAVCSNDKKQCEPVAVDVEL